MSNRGKKRMTLQQLEKLVPAARLIIPPENKTLKVLARKSNTNTEEKAQLGLILFALSQKYEIELVAEMMFSDKRNFLFDWAYPDLNIAIEYEGLMSEKSGHTTITGFTKDCDKYNLAGIEGWTVLRYTALNYQKAGTDLIELIENYIY